ncbi:hypothetical protein AD940_00185 [Gluconobacter thailandicus]|nr:hypothetical protein AD940_00185 [Gluconobacter thailandicus]
MLHAAIASAKPMPALVLIILIIDVSRTQGIRAFMRDHINTKIKINADLLLIHQFRRLFQRRRFIWQGRGIGGRWYGWRHWRWRIGQFTCVTFQ